MSLLPKVALTSSLRDILDGAQQPSFVALTDSLVLFEHPLHFNTGFLGELARCEKEGNFILRPEVEKHSDKFIIALDSKRPFNLFDTIKVQSVLDTCQRTIQMTIWPPLAVQPSVLTTVEKIKGLIGSLWPGESTVNLMWRLFNLLPAIMDNNGP